MKITLTVENESPFDAGWLACHMGLPADCMPELEGMARESFDEGYKMRGETADMHKPDEMGHGGCHVAFLMMATNQNVVPFVRARVGISGQNAQPHAPATNER